MYNPELSTGTDELEPGAALQYQHNSGSQYCFRGVKRHCRHFSLSTYKGTLNTLYSYMRSTIFTFYATTAIGLRRRANKHAPGTVIIAKRISLRPWERVLELEHTLRQGLPQAGGNYRRHLLLTWIFAHTSSSSPKPCSEYVSTVPTLQGDNVNAW